MTNSYTCRCEVCFLPDIRDTEKSQIREIAKEFSSILLQIPFSEGLILYARTNNELYVHPARWRFCLKCGEINKTDKMENHHCLMDVEEFPILIQTSWYKLKKFFLTDKFKDFMKDTTVSKLASQPLVSAVSDETKLLEKSEDPTAQKEKV